MSRGRARLAAELACAGEPMLPLLACSGTARLPTLQAAAACACGSEMRWERQAGWTGLGWKEGGRVQQHGGGGGGVYAGPRPSCAVLHGI